MKTHKPDSLRNFKFEYRITLIYLVFGVLWILFSDTILELLLKDNDLLTEFQTFKGTFFVIVTSGFLYVLVRRHMQSLKIAENQLIESEALFATIFDSSPIPISLSDLSTEKCLRVNDAFLDVTGYTRPEFIGQSYMDSGMWKRPGDVLKMKEILRQQGRVINMEMDIIKKDGSTGTLLISMEIINLTGKSYSIIMGNEITEWKYANEALRNQGELLKDVGRIAHIGGWEFNPVTGESSWTEEVARIHDLDPQAMASVEKGINFYHGESHQIITKAVHEIIEFARPYDLELEIMSAKGVLKWVRTIGHAVVENGKVVRVHGSLQDITDRKQAEDKLKESYALLRIAGEKAKLGGWNVNLEENQTYWSDQVAAIHEMPEGYSPSLEDGLNFYAPEWRDKIIAVFTRCRNEGIPYDEEMEIITSTGKRVWVRAIGEAVRDDKGNIVKVNGAFQDISQRKQIENEFLESELNFHRSISESPVGIRIVTTEGKTIYANKAFLDITEFNSLEEFTGTPSIKRYTPESYFQHQQRKKERKSGGDVFNYEISIVCKNDKIKHVKVSRKEVLWNGTKHFQVINMDITDQRNAEEQLRILSQAVEQSPDAISITNPQGIIEYVNPKTIQLTGYSAEELINVKTSIFKSGKTSKEKYAQLWQTIKSGNIWSGELHNKKKSGELYWESTTISPIFDTTGQITHFLSIKEDITDRKRAEIILSKSEEQLRKFASHLQNVREEEKVALAREIHDDLGQILVVLKIEMGLLKQHVQKNNATAGSQEMLEKFDNLVALIDKTIKTARRIMNGLRPELLELLGFVGATKAYLKQFEERYELTFEFTCEPADIELNSQQALALFRILQEALNNIVRHAKASLVKIQLRNEADKLIMEISDNGTGFDKNNSGRPDSYGMIGMKERVVLLEGKLDITTEIGKGTCVRVEIPWDMG